MARRATSTSRSGNWPHERFTRDGVDLHCTVHIPMTAAALGTSMSLAGPARQRGSGRRSRHPVGDRHSDARSRHAAHCAAPAAARCFVHIEVVTPTKIDDKQAELLRELATVRGEEQPEYAAKAHGGGFFNRLRDSFGGR